MTQNTKLGSRDHTENPGNKPLPVKLAILLFLFFKTAGDKDLFETDQTNSSSLSKPKKESSFRCHYLSKMAQTEPFDAIFVALCNKTILVVGTN